jgi:hypothetical protein
MDCRAGHDNEIVNQYVVRSTTEKNHGLLSVHMGLESMFPFYMGLEIAYFSESSVTSLNLTFEAFPIDTQLKREDFHRANAEFFFEIAYLVLSSCVLICRCKLSLLVRIFLHPGTGQLCK